MIADIFNKPVSVGDNPDNIARGAFLLYATDMGIFKSLDEAARSVMLANTYSPNKVNHQVYEKYYSIFERLSTKLYDEFEAISRYQNEQ